MHEILTLQLGQKSNYLATHFWNAQESYFTYSANDESPVDHDIHFRPGIGVDGVETFTPRTVIYDLKGGFGSLKKLNALYDVSEENPANSSQWDGAISSIHEPPITVHPYQQSLDFDLPPLPLKKETVRYWSDFNHMYYHPKSIVQLNDYELNSTLMPFESWSCGEELFNDLDRENDLLDRDLRPFAEECDHIQAIQMITSTDDAWGGFAAKYAERLKDEYGKACLWVWGLEDQKRIAKEKQLQRSANVIRSLSNVSTQATTYIPIALPSMRSRNIDLDVTSEWHTSALTATAMESMTLLSRLKPSFGQLKLDHIETNLNLQGKRTITGLKCSIADQDTYNAQFPKPHELENQKRPNFQNEEPVADMEDSTFELAFTPASKVRGKRGHVFAQSEVLRGNYQSPRTMEEDEAQYEKKRRRIAGLPVVEKHHTGLEFPLLYTFPKILSRVSKQTTSVPVRSALITSTEVANYIKAAKLQISPLIPVEEREELANQLQQMAEDYEEGYESWSDDDDDL